MVRIVGAIIVLAIEGRLLLSKNHLLSKHSHQLKLTIQTQTSNFPVWNKGLTTRITPQILPSLHKTRLKSNNRLLIISKFNLIAIVVVSRNLRVHRMLILI